MVDIHCHILPGVDDGADSLDAACRMAAIAAHCGVDTIVATPHCNTRNENKNYRLSALDEKFRALQNSFDYYHIPIRVLPGAEVLARGNMEQLLAERRFYTIAGSRYLLTEFYFDEPPEYMDDQLSRIASFGYTPVVAHPERYLAVNKDPEIVRRWFKRGYIIQVNKGSLLGMLTEEAYDTAYYLLSQHLVDLVASDAHDYEMRTPNLSELCIRLEEVISEDYIRLLVETNPRRLIENRSVLRPHEGS